MLQRVEQVVGQAPEDKWVIWLHGLGASGHDFVDVLPFVPLNTESGACRFVFPHAPERPITLNAGMVMRGWYDIVGLTESDRVDREGVLDSVEKVHHLLDEAVASGMPSEKIALVGFSQGGAVAINAALRYHKPLAGVAGLSTYFPLFEDYPEALSAANATIPMWIGHGEADDVVLPAWGEHAAEKAAALSLPVEFMSYPHLPHSVSEEEMQHLGQWLSSCLGR